MDYQLDFLTPGILPSLASSLKQIRHKPNFLINPRLRPHFQQRLTILVEYFGVFFDFAICALVAIINTYFTNGKPNFLSKALASSLFFALVLITTSKPCTLSISSAFTSGKDRFSLKP